MYNINLSLFLHCHPLLSLSLYCFSIVSEDSVGYQPRATDVRDGLLWTQEVFQPGLKLEGLNKLAVSMEDGVSVFI